MKYQDEAHAQAATPRASKRESDLLKSLRVWIAALAVVCLTVGVGIGLLLAGRPARAQNEQQIARAPEALSASFAEIARRVEPAVVNIDTVSAPEATAADEDGEEEGGGSNATPRGNSNNGGGGGSNPWQEFFQRRQRRALRGVGSGFIIDPKGLILTNQHVIDGATRITVQLQTGEKLRATVLGVDEETDVAVLKVNAGRDLPSVRLGNSEDAQVGDWVLAIGSPFGLDQTVTAGIVSTIGRQPDGASNFQRFIQTDAAINRGNSGGPLVNMRGEVVGINSQIATTTGDYNGIGFALPSNEAGFVFKQVLASGKVKRGYLGVLLDPVQTEYARVYNLPEAKGTIIRDVREGPAKKAGIEFGDVVVEFNGQQLKNSQDLISRVALTPVGQIVQLTYLRETNGKLERRTAAVTIGERPGLTEEDIEGSSLKRDILRKQREQQQQRNNAASERVRLGVTLSELTPALVTERRLQGVRGLLIKDVEQGGLGEDAGLAESMVIVRINRTPVATLAEFERIIGALKPGDAVVMNVAAREGNRIVQRIIQFTYQ